MIEIFASYYKDLEKELKKAGIKESILEYTKKSVQYSLIIAISIGFLGGFFTFLMMMLRFKLFIIHIPLIVGIILGIISFFSGILFFRSYPSLVASEREKKIDNSLYIATVYMASMVTGGNNPVDIFRLFSTLKEFGELQKEAKEIIEMVDALGIPLHEALHIKSQTTPSKKLAELLEGIRAVITSGGSLDTFLYEKARQYSEEYKRRLIEYSNTLQVLLEIYITLVVIGVMFVIIITALMGSITGFTQSLQMMQLLSIIGIMPMATIMFIIIIKSINPFEY